MAWTEVRGALSPLVLGCAMVLLSLGGATAAQSLPIDPREVVLNATDLPAGYLAEPVQSLQRGAPEGGLTAIATFRQSLPGDGPLLIRSTAHSLPSPDAAAGLFSQTPADLAAAGFSETAAPRIGDASAGFASPDVLAGQEVVYQTLVYRLGALVVLTTVVGPPGTISIDDAAQYARLTVARASSGLGLAQTPSPDPAQAVGLPSLPPIDGQPAPFVAPAAPSEPVSGRPAPSSAAQLSAPVGPPGVLASVALLDPPELGSGIRLGGFSGLVALDGSGSRFVTVTDRGPNKELGSGKNKKLTFALPSYSPSIVTVELQDGSLRVVDRVPLKLPGGFQDSMTGTDLISGVSSAPRDELPWSRSGRERLDFDRYGVDTEGLAWDRRDGGFWLSDEYGPSIIHVAADGTLLLRLVPGGLGVDWPGVAVRDILPADLAHRKENRGLEGIALSPDGSTLFAIMQSPLSIPDEHAGEESRNLRLLRLDVTNSDQPRLTGMFLYRTEPGSRVGSDQDDMKVGDLAALSTTRLLVAERDNLIGGRHKMVYRVDLDGATDLLERDTGRRAIEQMSESDLRSARLKPVGKQEVSDLSRLGYSPEKLEGLAIVDDSTIAVVNDNDFGFDGFDGEQAVPNGIETRLVLIRLDQPVR